MSPSQNPGMDSQNRAAAIEVNVQFVPNHIGDGTLCQVTPDVFVSELFRGFPLNRRASVGEMPPGAASGGTFALNSTTPYC